MSTITITISIDVPAGASVAISGGAPAQPAYTSLESESEWVCPEHGGARTVPAGVSKKTGKPYPAFRVCVRQDCDQKEPSR